MTAAAVPVTARGLVWLASYPKSGNTWTRLFLGQLLSDGHEPVDLDAIEVGGSISSDRRSFDEVLAIPSADLTPDEVDALRPAVYRAWGEKARWPFIVKAHDANHTVVDGRPLFPPEVSAAAVHLVRNPLDVVVSYAFHTGRADFDRTIAHLNDPRRAIGNRGFQLRQRLLDWSGHTRSWADETAFPVLTVRYEDLVADPVGRFSAIAAFLGLDGADDPQRVERAVAATRFDVLQAAEEREGFRERHRRQDRFFRSGRTGDWRRHLSALQVAAVVDAHRDEMRRHGYLDDDGRPR